MDSFLSSSVFIRGIRGKKSGSNGRGYEKVHSHIGGMIQPRLDEKTGAAADRARLPCEDVDPLPDDENVLTD
jgi:hypothetical protein